MKHPTYQIKPAYREGMGAVVRDLLAGIGVTPSSMGFHVNGTVTVTVTDAQLATMRTELVGLVEFSGHSNAGKITISTPEILAYFKENSPIYTDAERAAMKASAGKGGFNREESERRKALLAEQARLAKELHGIDLED